jgi:tight adherence protein C
MTPQLWLASATIAASLCLLVLALATGGSASGAAPADTPAAVGGPRRRDAPDTLPSILRRLGDATRRLTPADYAGRLQPKLDRAGNPRNWSPERVLALKGLALLGGAALGLLYGAKRGGPWPVMGPAGLGGFGFVLPDILIRNFGERRQQELQKGLPDVMDMLTVCVEAGLGFDAALSRVARNLTGPMAEECARVLQEMQFGKSRAEALRALAERTGVPELRTFVSAMIQASELGISIANVLREQAREMRLKRRQRAEEKAQKLQVKILGPLIVCLLPCIFIVVLGPAIMKVAGFFSSVNG